MRNSLIQGSLKIKSYNGRRNFIVPMLVYDLFPLYFPVKLTKPPRRPYYIWLGCSRSRDVSRFCHAFEIEGGNRITNGTHIFAGTMSHKDYAHMPEIELGGRAPQIIPGPSSEGSGGVKDIDITPPLR